LADKIFGRQNIWQTKYLADKIFGWQNIWLTHYLADKIFGWQNIWLTHYLVTHCLAETIFAWQNIWQTPLFGEQLIGSTSVLSYHPSWPNVSQQNGFRPKVVEPLKLNHLHCNLSSGLRHLL
jgi:hypothetical protein